jgi:hypothetical protein
MWVMPITFFFYATAVDQQRHPDGPERRGPRGGVRQAIGLALTQLARGTGFSTALRARRNTRRVINL